MLKIRLQGTKNDIRSITIHNCQKQQLTIYFSPSLPFEGHEDMPASRFKDIAVSRIL